MHSFKSNILEQDSTAEREQNIKFREQLIQDLYPEKEVTQEMRKIKITMQKDDFGLANVFGDRIVNKFFVCENAMGEKGFFSVTMEDTTIKSVEVFLPFANREFLCNDGFFPYKFYTRNLDTGKMGEYVIGYRVVLNGKAVSGYGFILKEEYDNLVEGIKGDIVTVNNKKGRRLAGKDYDIPIKYDEIEEIDTSVITMLNGTIHRRETSDSLVLVKRNDKWGAYCYLYDYHTQYLWDKVESIRRRYIKKRHIAPLFDKIELHTIDDEKIRIILRVWLNNKVGLLEAYSKEFVCPIVFDRISKCEETTEGEIIVYGYIDDVLYRYFNGNFIKEETVHIEYPESYMKLLKTFEKK